MENISKAQNKKYFHQLLQKIVTQTDKNSVETKMQDIVKSKYSQEKERRTKYNFPFMSLEKKHWNELKQEKTINKSAIIQFLWTEMYTHFVLFQIFDFFMKTHIQKKYRNYTVCIKNLTGRRPSYELMR